jgi:hypothetical protein
MTDMRMLFWVVTICFSPVLVACALTWIGYGLVTLYHWARRALQT